MRIPVRSDIALKDDEGMIRFGRTEWIEKNKIRLQADAQPMQGALCDLTMELGQGQARVAALVRVVGIEPLGRGQFQLDCRIERMGERDRTRYAYFLHEQSRSVSGVRSAASLRGSSTSAAGRHQGRDALKRGLKSGLSRAKQAPAPTPEPPCATTRAGRNPAVTVDDATRAVTLTWTSPRVFRNDFETSLRKGTWLVRTAPPRHPEVTLRLELPDGQVVSLPARVEEQSRQSWGLTFRLGLALKTKMRKAAADA